MTVLVVKATEGERLMVVFKEGEIVYASDTKELWVGDGVTYGGKLVNNNNGAGEVTSVAGRSGDVVLSKADITDFADSDYATAAQGTLATSAVQAGDNNSVLVNDAGYLTSAPVTSVAGKVGVVTIDKANITDFSEGDYATGAEGDLATSATQPGSNVSTLTNDAGYITSAVVPSDSVGVLADVDLTGNATDKMLQFNGTSFVPVDAPSGGGGGEDYFACTSTGTLPDATGNDSIAIGETTSSDNTSTIAIGRNAQANTAYAVSIGDNAKVFSAGYGSVAIGRNAFSVTNSGIAIGRDSFDNSGDGGAIAIGYLANNSATAGIALGRNADQNSFRGIALGYNSDTATGHYNMAIGYAAIGGTSANTYCMAIGPSISTNTDHQVRIGVPTNYIDINGNGAFSIGGTSTQKQIVNPAHTTAARPTSPVAGSQVFDTTLNKPVWYTGAAWVDAAGTTV